MIFMVNKKLFEPCMMEYKEHDKPVKYTEDFLKELTMNIAGVRLVEEEHNGNIIGDVSNFNFTDGALFGEINTEHALDDLMYSPSFNCTLIDKGEYYLADNGQMIEIALTSNPRQAILNNTNSKGGSKMSENNNDETIKILNNQIKDLNKELAIANNKLKANDEKLNKFNEMEKELEELREWKETNSKLIEEQKPIIEDYKKQLETKKFELLEKVSNGNEEIKSKLQNMSVEDLETIAGLQTTEEPPQGISTNNAQGLNEGSGETDDEAEQKARNEAVEKMFDDLFTQEE